MPVVVSDLPVVCLKGVTKKQRTAKGKKQMQGGDRLHKPKKKKKNLIQNAKSPQTTKRNHVHNPFSPSAKVRDSNYYSIFPGALCTSFLTFNNWWWVTATLCSPRQPPGAARSINAKKNNKKKTNPRFGTLLRPDLPRTKQLQKTVWRPLSAFIIKPGLHFRLVHERFPHLKVTSLKRQAACPCSTIKVNVFCAS